MRPSLLSGGLTIGCRSVQAVPVEAGRPGVLPTGRRRRRRLPVAAEGRRLSAERLAVVLVLRPGVLRLPGLRMSRVVLVRPAGLTELAGLVGTEGTGAVEPHGLRRWVIGGRARLPLAVARSRRLRSGGRRGRVTRLSRRLLVDLRPAPECGRPRRSGPLLLRRGLVAPPERRWSTGGMLGGGADLERAAQRRLGRAGPVARLVPHHA